MNVSPPPARSRANRIGWLVVGVIVIALLAMSWLAWWNARALTHDELEHALKSQPANREAFYSELGQFTQHQHYATADLDQPIWRESFLAHPHFRGRHHWYDGRGGAGAVSTLFLIYSVASPSDHPTDDPMESPEDRRDYCIFLDAQSRVIGWLEATGGPTILELAEWHQSQPTAAK